MKFLVGYSRNHNRFVFGRLYRRGNYTAVSFRVVCPYHIGGFACEERVREFLDQAPAEYLVETLKKYDCSYSELIHNLRRDKGIEYFFDTDTDEDLNNISKNYFFEVRASGGFHDPRNDKITDWFIPEILFDKIMLFWNYYYMDNTPEAFEDFNYLTSKLIEGGYDDWDNAKTWMKKFLIDA